MEWNRQSGLMLALLAVTVFIVIAVLLVQIVPGPLKQSDYLVIGAVSTLAALAVAFGIVLRTAGIRDIFFRRRK